MTFATVVLQANIARRSRFRVVNLSEHPLVDGGKRL